MHLPFDDVRYSADASSSINYFFSVADAKYNLYEINKNNRANDTQCSETDRKWCWTEEVQDKDVDLSHVSHFFATSY